MYAEINNARNQNTQKELAERKEEAKRKEEEASIRTPRCHKTPRKIRVARIPSEKNDNINCQAREATSIMLGFLP